MKCFSFHYGAKKAAKGVSNPPLSCKSSSSKLGFNLVSGVSSPVASPNAASVRRSLSTSTFQNPHPLKVFTYSELRSATNDFNRSLVIGEGGFGCVYKGTIFSSDDPHGTLDVAIKQLGQRGLQGHKEWLTEVNFLGIVDHPNLVKLVGYCSEDDESGVQRLLVYEFMPNKSVLRHLSHRTTEPLSWNQRLKVALGAARGLNYLHEEFDFQIIFRDLKTSNILLDEHWNAKLSDFGLARQGPTEGVTHISTAVVGTIGYAAPEYMQTGRLTVKSDIWSYGVVLYELITGRRPFERSRPKGEQKLLEWIRPYISNIRKFHKIIDPRLGGQFSLKSAQQLAAVANSCLIRDPKSRPKMSEVLDMVKTVLQTAEFGKPQAPLLRILPDRREKTDDGKE